jgi:hypothetical protein
MLYSGEIGCFWLNGNGVMRNPALGLRRIHLLGTSVNKYHHARLSLLVNEEHALAKAVRCGLDTGLGVLLLRSVLCELLIGGDKLAGREHFTSAGCEDDAHSGSFFDNPPPRHLG